MTLVDTSVWIEFFRAKGDPALKRRVATLLRAGHAAYSCPIRYELLLGARADEERYVIAILDEAQRIRFREEPWELAILLGRKLRSAGVSVPSNDVFVASVSISMHMRLLSKDKHFDMMKRVFGNRLQLDSEP